MAKQKPKKQVAKLIPVQSVPKPTMAEVADFPAWPVNARLQAWLIFALGFLLYANTFSHDYTQDDAIVITDNMFTTQGVAGISGILRYDTFYGFFKDPSKKNLVAGGRYRPLTLMMFAVEHQFFGKNPFVGHLINAVLYGLTGFVLYWLLLQLFKQKENMVAAHLVALAASLLFVTHPIHTEAVANIKGRDEIVALLGSLAALYFSLKAYLNKKGILNIIAGALFFLALLSKENAITFVAVAPLTYYFFTKANYKKNIAQTVPFLIAAIAFVIIRTYVLEGDISSLSRFSSKQSSVRYFVQLFMGANVISLPTELMNNPFLKLQAGQYVPFTSEERFATVLFTLGKYVQLLVFPQPLTHDYYPRHIGIMNFGDWQVLLSLLLYVGLIIYAVIGFRKKDAISYGILFYLLTLSIVSNLVFPVGTNMAERLLFMPSVGFCIVIAVLLQRLFFSKKLTTTKQLYSFFGVLLLLSALFSVKTITRNPAWKSNFTLFQTDIKTSPNSAKLRNAMGGELVVQSVKPENEPRRTAMLNEAAGHLRAAVNIHPTYKNAYLLLGNCYNYLQQYDSSIVNYNKALQLDPNYTEAFDNLAITYQQAGKFYGEQRGDLAKAIQYLEQADKLKPNNYETVRLLGVAHGIGGNIQKAIEYFTKGTQLAPNNAGAWYDLGTAYYNAGDPVKGNEYIQKAVQLEPDIVTKRNRQ